MSSKNESMKRRMPVHLQLPILCETPKKVTVNKPIYATWHLAIKEELHFIFPGQEIKATAVDMINVLLNQITNSIVIYVKKKHN